MTKTSALRSLSRPRKLLALVCPLGMAILSAEPALAESPTAREIIDRYIATQTVESELAYVSLKRFASGELVDDKRLVALTRKDGGIRSSVMRLQRPKELEGVAALFVDPEEGSPSIYQYLPEIGKTREIKGRGARAPFLGSDFSLQDLQREIPTENDYERLADSEIDDTVCHVVQAVPKQPERSAYARRVLHIGKDTNQLMQVDFFAAADDKMPVKVFNAFAYGSAEVKGETRRPARAVMINHEKNTTSILRVIESRLGPDLEAGLFTPDGIAAIESKDVYGLLLGLDFEIRFDAD